MITFEYTLHMKFWECLSRNPMSTKKEAIIDMYRLSIIDKDELAILSGAKNLCVACHYAVSVAGDENPCIFCPLDISKLEKPNDSCLGGLYNTWSSLTNQYRSMITMSMSDGLISTQYFRRKTDTWFDMKNANQRLSTVSALHLYFQTLRDKIFEVANTIQELPVKSGVSFK